MREERLSPEKLALCHNLTEELEKEFLVHVTYGRDYMQLQGSEVKVIMALSKVQELRCPERHPNGLEPDVTAFHTEQTADRWAAHSGSHSNRPNAKIEKKVNEFVSLGFEEDAIRSVIEKSGSQLSHEELMTKLLQMKKPNPHGGSLVSRTPTIAEPTPPPPIVNPTDQRLRPVIIDGSNVAMR